MHRHFRILSGILALLLSGLLGLELNTIAAAASARPAPINEWVVVSRLGGTPTSCFDLVPPYFLYEAMVPRDSIGDDDVLYAPEIWPVWRKCSAAGNLFEQKRCSDRALNDHVYDNFISQRQGLPAKGGFAVVAFVVEANGSVSTPVILRDPGDGFGEELLRVIKLLTQLDRPFLPGRHDGKPVRVRYTFSCRVHIGCG